MTARKSLKGTWAQALLSFFGPILLILALRWAILEPYVIPSGSMIPNLLVHDHIFVKKFSFGVRLPFSDHWLVRWSEPQPGDIIVFRSPDSPEVFYIKRLIAGPGARVSVEGGKVSVDGEEWALTEPTEEPGDFDSEDFVYRTETNGRAEYAVRFAGEPGGSTREWIVPEGEYFFMGDNRDQSSDSRVWGSVPEKNLIGKAWFIWLSCDDMLESAKFLCDPTSMRWSRIGQRVAQP